MESTLSSLVSLKGKGPSPAARTLFRPLCLPSSFTSLSLRSRSPFPRSLFASAGVSTVGGSDGGDGDGNDASSLSPDVIVLRVGGMTCGGCAASVKRILENQPQVSSASVNLTTDTAIVWPVPEAKSFSMGRKQLGELLAEHLTSCGFTSNLQGF